MFKLDNESFEELIERMISTSPRDSWFKTWRCGQNIFNQFKDSQQVKNGLNLVLDENLGDNEIVVDLESM